RSAVPVSRSGARAEPATATATPTGNPAKLRASGTRVAGGAAMKASIEHLPEKKRAKLAAIAEKIRAEAPGAEMVVLFGSHARGDWVEDPETGYRSDYDLLVVVESAEMAEDHALWARVERAVGPIAEPAPVTLIVHEFRELNQQIRRGQF